MREGNHYGRLETRLGLSGKASWGCGKLQSHSQRKKKITVWCLGQKSTISLWEQTMWDLLQGCLEKSAKNSGIKLRTCFWTRSMVEKLAWIYYCTIGEHCQYAPDRSSSESVTAGRDQITSTNGTLLSSFSQDAKGWLDMKGDRWTLLKRSLPWCWHCVNLCPAEKLFLAWSR